MTPRLVVSVGCPAGIGPEVSVRAALAAESHDLLLVGDLAVLRAALDVCGLDADLALVAGPDAVLAAPGARPVLRVWQPTRSLTAKARRPGEPTPEGGAAQLAWIDAALDAVQRGHAQAMVTGPASKAAVVSGGELTFRGHTEYLAAKLGARSVTMAFATDRFTTALCTTHLPLAKVPRALTEQCVAQAAVHLGAYVAARAPARQRPRVAVCGLNPHAGEGGLLGHEEVRIGAGVALAASVLAGHELAVDLVGPLPAESAFRLAADGRFEGVLAMYHDQATIPTKLLGFGDAVNVSLGLPIVRTSVDHGTAYDQAGKGTADARGMQSAVRLARALAAEGAWPFTGRGPAALDVPRRPRAPRRARTPRT